MTPKLCLCHRVTLVTWAFCSSLWGIWAISRWMKWKWTFRALIWTTSRASVEKKLVFTCHCSIASSSRSAERNPSAMTIGTSSTVLWFCQSTADSCQAQKTMCSAPHSSPMLLCALSWSPSSCKPCRSPPTLPDTPTPSLHLYLSHKILKRWKRTARFITRPGKISVRQESRYWTLFHAGIQEWGGSCF